MNATEAQDKVVAILSAAQVSFAPVYAGQTKRDKWECDAWRIRFAAGSKMIETDYFTGLGLRKAGKFTPPSRFPRSTVGHAQWEKANLKPVTPSAADVLHSLTLDAEADSMSFRDWCDNFGYSDDSIDALEIYRKCCKIAEQLRAIFKREVLAEIRAALQDY